MCGIELESFWVDIGGSGEEAIVSVTISNSSLTSFAIDFDLDGLVGELLDSIEDDVASHGEGAVFCLVVDFQGAGQAVTLVCSGEGKYIALQLEEDIFEYGDCSYAFLIDDLGDSLEL